MKSIKNVVALGIFLSLFQANAFSQTFKSNDKAKDYFYSLDDRFNVAIAARDSLFFANGFADNYINCTPIGIINNKKEEIQTLLKLSPLKVERVAQKFDIFTYSNKLATLSVIKKLTMKDLSILYVRRTIVHKLIDGKWQFVSGQGTNVLPKYVETN